MAAQLAANNKLGFFDSVLAQTQTNGRGQMRRKWISPTGNIYATLRLPNINPFDQDYAAPATGALLAHALNALGLNIKLKWPNDLVCVHDDQIYKIGGILIEERAGVILAGIGLNYASAPRKEALSTDALLEARSLASLNYVHNPNDPREFWRKLVRKLISTYKEDNTFSQNWPNIFNALMVFKNESVLVEDDGATLQGQVMGITEQGNLKLLTHQGLIQLRSGSIRRRDQAKD